MKCCICKKEFNGYGNNPYPLRTTGVCCDECNILVIIMERLRLLRVRDSKDKRIFLKRM